MTVRGCSMARLVSAWSNGHDGLHEELVEVGLLRQADHELDRVDSPGRGRFGHGRVGRHGPLEHLHAIELGGPGLAAERPAVGAPVGGGHEALHQVRILAGRPPAPRGAGPATARHSGSPSKGSWVRNDDMVPMPRQWVSPNMRPPAAAVASISPSAAGAAAPDGDGHAGAHGQVDEAVVACGIVRRRAGPARAGRHRCPGRPAPRPARPPPPTRPAGRRPGDRRRSGGARCATW